MDPWGENIEWNIVIITVFFCGRLFGFSPRLKQTWHTQPRVVLDMQTHILLIKCVECVSYGRLKRHLTSSIIIIKRANSALWGDFRENCHKYPNDRPTELKNTQISVLWCINCTRRRKIMGMKVGVWRHRALTCTFCQKIPENLIKLQPWLC